MSTIPTNDRDHHFQRSLATDSQGRDEIDRDFDADIPNPPAMRGRRETKQLLDLLDGLATPTRGKKS
jgi:hypothetical protein